ncbi:hypothetical protein J2S41_002722 [Catenuloplanes atrovinosus]|uniref:Uncharacterized protein n=1 Tax=Catenuloplanes atrovinosus TaxID=137266 RepID=A0AAE3YLC0_9ACTN|nr:hypothetical protein [Catenuloplanes atrovinosus]
MCPDRSTERVGRSSVLAVGGMSLDRPPLAHDGWVPLCDPSVAGAGAGSVTCPARIVGA